MIKWMQKDARYGYRLKDEIKPSKKVDKSITKLKSLMSSKAKLIKQRAAYKGTLVLIIEYGGWHSVTDEALAHTRTIRGTFVFICCPSHRALSGETNDNNALQDPLILKRLNKINNLPNKEKEALLLTLDAFLRDFKTK